MPNEFVIKNGFISKGNSIVEGNLRVNGQTTLVQPQGSDYIVFSSSTLANSGQTMYIRQTATNTYTFGTSGIGQFMSVGASNLVDFSNQAIQTNGSAIFGSIRQLQPYILNLNEIPSGVTAGTQDYRGVLVNPTVNFGGTYSGNFIGYLHNPTITSMANGRHIAMQIVSGDVLLNTTSGNVGIGTTTPTAKLDIFASSALTNTIRIRETGNTFNNLIIDNSGTTTIRTNGGGGATQFSVVHNGGTENFRVRENSIINFRSAHAFDDSTQMGIFVGRDLTNGLIINTLNIYDTSNTNRNLVGFTPSFSWAGGNNTGSTLNIAPTYNIIGGSTTALVRGIYYNPSLQSLSGTTHRAIETTTGDVIFGSTSGNVGIGTLTPTAKLDIVGGNVALNNNALLLGPSLGNTVLRTINGGNDLQLFNNNATGNLLLNSASKITFGQNGTPANWWATFFNTGNLVIQSGGTHVDAGYRLDVSGNTRVSGDLTVIGSVIPNTQIISSSASVTPTYGNDLVAITGLSTNVTINNPTGTWPEGKNLTIRIKDDGIARTIGWDTKYRAIGVSLPNTTVASKLTYVSLIYNLIDDKFDVIISTTEL